MSKIIFILIFLSISAFTKSARAQDTTIFHHGVTLTYPLNKNIYIDFLEFKSHDSDPAIKEDGGCIISLFPDTSGIHSFLSIYKNELSISATFDDLIKKVKADFSNFKIEKEKRYKLNSYPVYELVCSWKEEGVELHSFQRILYIKSSDTKVSVIRYEGDEITYPNYYKMMNSIIRSIRFN